MKHTQLFLRVACSLIIFFSLLLATNICIAQILSYTNDPTGAVNSVVTNAAGTPLIRVNGATVPASPCATGFSSKSFTAVTTFDTTLRAIEVSVAPDAGFVLNITGFSVDLRRTGTGPAAVRLAYSTDGGTLWTDQGTNQAPNNATCGTTTTGTWATSFSVTAPATLKFRVYGFNAGSTAGALQILNLFINGTIASTSGCVMPSGLFSTSITSSTATLHWLPVTGATNYNVRYRKTGTIPWTTITSGVTFTAIGGLTANTNYEYQAQARCTAPDTSGYTSSSYFTTAVSASASSGKINIYFNNPVNNTVSTGLNAVYLDSCMADTIIAYINRAHYSIDIAVYNYVQGAFANIATAVNNAYASGVRVRWIYDGTASNTGIALLNPGIHTLASPTGGSYNIMHNKFMVIDAHSSNPNDAIVATGSVNWTAQQLNHDFNNQLFIQDSALARAYTSEFNMMWGDTGLVPNLGLSKFGPFKTDLGLHVFNIGGKTVELYFSPSDGTNSRIASSVNSANTDLYFGVYTFTDVTDANDIVARNTAGVYCAGIVDANSTSFAAYPILTAGLGTNFKTYSGSYLYHSKMLIVDQSNACSDPLVLTGSHNWTDAANTQNDENTLIIHNDTIANVYYQSFYANFASLGGSLTAITPCPTGTTYTTVTGHLVDDFHVYPNPATQDITVTYDLANAELVTISIYNLLGQEVVKVGKTELQQPGSHSYNTILPAPGMYFVKLSVGNNTLIKKVVRW
jgi:PLD-like domain/Secretion system C-terminal sorting domain/Fibronectin type III domain